MICFVVIGYGIKTDYRTGRQLNLDKTYEVLIKPVFDDLGITCVRSCDIPHSGIIDVPMYENILKADIVVADLSTLNANAIYELGVRHALRPNTTIVIAESQLAYPFDLNHILITQYEHMGNEIASSEAARFSAELKKLVNAVIKTPGTDSPVYTFLHNLQPPHYTKEEVSDIIQHAGREDSISSLLAEAEQLKNNKQFPEAIDKLKTARERDSNNPFITQRIALLTYKSKLPDAVTSLNNALKELAALHPDTTNDPETLGLCGAIYKRLFEETKLNAYLNKAKSFYERGFLIAKDYYNGINLAYLLLLNASLSINEEDKIADTVNARRVRSITAGICNNKMNDDHFTEMPDKNWILLTMAEICFTDGKTDEESQYIATAKLQGLTDFELDSYNEQRARISGLLDKL